MLSINVISISTNVRHRLLQGSSSGRHLPQNLAKHPLTPGSSFMALVYSPVEFIHILNQGRDASPHPLPT